MTDPFIEEIKKRVEAATPGPWLATRKAGNLTEISDKGGTICSVSRWCYGEHYDLENEPNAQFIIYARTDIPKLLALVDIYEEALRLISTFRGNCNCDSFSEAALLEGEKIKRGSNE